MDTAKPTETLQDLLGDQFYQTKCTSHIELHVELWCLKKTSKTAETLWFKNILTPSEISCRTWLSTWFILFVDMRGSESFRKKLLKITLTCRLAWKTFSSISSTSLRIALSTANATSGNNLSSMGLFLFFSEDDFPGVSLSSSESLSTSVCMERETNDTCQLKMISYEVIKELTTTFINLLHPCFCLVLGAAWRYCIVTLLPPSVPGWDHPPSQRNCLIPLQTAFIREYKKIRTALVMATATS